MVSVDTFMVIALRGRSTFSADNEPIASAALRQWQPEAAAPSDASATSRIHSIMNKSFLTKAVLASTLGMALLAASVRLGWIGGNAPAGLGVHDGRLKPPSTTPNSVSSQADLYPDRPQARRAAIEPLAFSGDGLQAMRRLAAVLQRHERTRIVQDDGDYLRAEARSETLGFVDDLEFWLDRANGVIQVRSASRLGYGDRDVNRTRIEALRGAFARDAARRTAGRPAVRTVGLG